MSQHCGAAREALDQKSFTVGYCFGWEQWTSRSSSRAHQQACKWKHWGLSITARRRKLFGAPQPAWMCLLQLNNHFQMLWLNMSHNLSENLGGVLRGWGFCIFESQKGLGSEEGFVPLSCSPVPSSSGPEAAQWVLLQRRAPAPDLESVQDDQKDEAAPLLGGKALLCAGNWGCAAWKRGAFGVT